ncbi:hypothetical protein SLS55_000372 [Diplodia seriata]|uniref:Rhodopsin domain-containing protein n=1 Tax=Diplodia seriata TaxID=420778 RepID=A0ABR3CU48_9PEZI
MKLALWLSALLAAVVPTIQAASAAELQQIVSVMPACGIYYFDEDLYLSALPLLKISILLFYLRIFPEKGFRRAVFVTIGLCIGYCIAFVLVSVFQCRPIRYAWLQWDDEHEGTCNNINAQGWSSAAINVILDIIVIILPLPQLWELQLNKRKKFLLLLMFSVGFL